MQIDMWTDLNKEAKGLTLDEEKALKKAFPRHTPDAERELVRFFERVKKAAQVFGWVVKGEAVVESFSAGCAVIELKTKDGRSHRVELY